MIQMYHVFKSYGGEGYALSDITLKVQKGGFVFLTGPSGAGKTTLLKLLFLAEAPDRGQIIICGINALRVKPRDAHVLRRKVGVVFQDFKLLPERSVFDNVALALEVVAVGRNEVRRRVKKVLRQVGLGGKEQTLAKRLSGGEQQRVAIARAIVNNPRVLLADEPTGNLDAEITEEIMMLLRDVSLNGTTVIMATHNRGLINLVPNSRVVYIKEGRLVGESA
jgi:cell division transport system ATP-binding protein